MSRRLSEDERATLEHTLARAEFWAKNMEDHGQYDTAFHADARRLRAVLDAESGKDESADTGGLEDGE